MVSSIATPFENGVFGNGRQSGPQEGQRPFDRGSLPEAEKTQPASSTARVTVRLSDAARAPSGDVQSVRGASAGEKVRESLSSTAADLASNPLDGKAEDGLSPFEALQASRVAFALALASGDSGEVAAAGRQLAEAKAEASSEHAGVPSRASSVVEEATISYDPESGRYLPGIRRVALSVETEPGETAVDPRRLNPRDKGVSVIHADPAVPTRQVQLTDTPPAIATRIRG